MALTGRALPLDELAARYNVDVSAERHCGPLGRRAAPNYDDLP
jgi:hypothetical protein